MTAIFAPLTIASVNTGTDELTFSSPHSLNTGDPFLMVYSPDGATFPSPLAPVTHYWAIRSSDTVLKLATSSTNAMTGVAVNLTTTGGGGTLQLLRGLPYSIPAILVPFAQLNPDHLQQAFESVEALWALLTAQPQSVFPAVSLAGALTVGGDVTVAGLLRFSTALSLYLPGELFTLDTGSTASRSGSVWTIPGASTLSLSCPVRLPVGFRIKEILWSYDRTDGSAQFELINRSFGDGGATSNTISTKTVSSGTGWTTAAASTGSPAGVPHQILDGFYYKLRPTFLTSSNPFLFDGCKVIIDRP